MKTKRERVEETLDNYYMARLQLNELIRSGNSGKQVEALKLRIELTVDYIFKKWNDKQEAKK
jgi:hypothetical protein